jgi:hypothetical protein
VTCVALFDGFEERRFGGFGSFRHKTPNADASGSGSLPPIHLTKELK